MGAHVERGAAMPPAEVLAPFLVATGVFALVPGPGMLYAAAQTLALGRRGGWLSALGFHVAGLGHVTAAAFGVAAVLALSPALFAALKLAGAAYLIAMGVRYLRGVPLAAADGGTPIRSPRRAWRDSVVVEALNPKSALFFWAFLPQFTDAAAALPIWAQLGVLGLFVNVVFSASDAVVIETCHAVAGRLRRTARAVAVVQRVAGGVLVGLGADLALLRAP